MTLLPDFFIIEVYNPGMEDLSLIRRNGEITMKAKFGAVLCTGSVNDVFVRAEGGNKVYSITIADGQAFWETKISKSVGPGALFSATVREILQNASMGSYLAPDHRFVRSQTFSGRLADCISDIARGVHARAFISRNVLHIVEKGKAEVVVTVNPDDITEVPGNATGVALLKTSVKGWPVGMFVRYDGKNLRLVSQEINADNFEGVWETGLVLVDEEYLSEDGMDGG